MTTPTFRPATADDHAWLYRLHEAAHRDLVERAYGPWEDGEQRAFFQPLLDEREVFVIDDDGMPVGAVYLGVQDGDTWLELIEVLPERQGHGLGTAALEWVCGRSADAGRGTLLQVHRVNTAARRLYLRQGFVPVRETRTHHVLRRAPGSPNGLRAW